MKGGKMEIELGNAFQHKATGKKCVVIQLLENDRVFVRDEDNLIQEYNKSEFEEIPTSHFSD